MHFHSEKFMVSGNLWILIWNLFNGDVGEKTANFGISFSKMISYIKSKNVLWAFCMLIIFSKAIKQFLNSHRILSVTE